MLRGPNLLFASSEEGKEKPDEVSGLDCDIHAFNPVIFFL
jgi:hypothetical protein